ncbi:putative E3 ubiquitin-protein ligase herc1, partial [Xenoophorus captivus]
LYEKYSKKKLRHGDSNSRNIPTLVKDISNVGEVSCGSSHTIALSKDGRTVWSFGGGDNGVTCLFYNVLRPSES